MHCTLPRLQRGRHELPGPGYRCQCKLSRHNTAQLRHDPARSSHENRHSVHSFTAYLLRRIPQFFPRRQELHEMDCTRQPRRMRKFSPGCTQSHLQMRRVNARLQAKQQRRPPARHQRNITATPINSNIPERMQEDSFFFVAKISFEDCQDLLETVSCRNGKRHQPCGNWSEAIFPQIAEANQLYVYHENLTEEILFTGHGRKK